MGRMNPQLLKTLLKEKGVQQTELAVLLGRDKAVITNLLQGKRHLKAEEAVIIAKYLGVPVTRLLGEKAVPGKAAEPVLIPFQHAPVMLKKSRQVIEKGGKYYIEDSSAASAKTYALEVRDDALNLSGILPGDVVICQADGKARKGQIVVAQHYQGRGAETILRKYEPPYLMPHSANPAHKPLSEKEHDVRVVAPVIKLIRLL